MRGGRDPQTRGRRERAIELGNEPALSVDRRKGPPDSKVVSGRWLAGTVLTGVASSALMGGALYASVDWESRFARSAETVVSLVSEGEGLPAGAGKGARLALAAPLVSTKQMVQLETVMRVGEREYIKSRPFARVTASLALTRGEGAENLPRFDAERVFGRAGGEDEPLAAASSRPIDGDVSLVMRDLADFGTQLDRVADLSQAEIASMVRETAEIGARMHAATALTEVDQESGSALDGRLVAFGANDLEGYADLAVRGYAENVSTIARSSRQAARAAMPAALGPDDRLVEIKAGETLDAILIGNGASREEAASIVGVLQERFPAQKMKAGLKVRLGISPGEDDRTRLRPVRVSLYDGEEHQGSVALSENGVGYVAIEDPADLVADAPEPEEADDQAGPRPTLYASLYETAHKNEVPRALVDTLVRVYSYDVDLQRRVKPGDQLELFYAAAEGTAAPEIFYTALTLEGETRRFYRYQAPEDGSVSFFDERGRSARKFLMNKPLQGGVFRSGYGMRRHPVLGYAKFHTGVDYAAPRGTPIMAAGNGTIEKVGWESGYGKYIRIAHSNGYETAYGHMSDYARGLAVGSKIQQGQVIGYVGSTGLSTGNHLHYEVLFKGKLQNPMNLKAQRGQELQGLALASFQRERERVDAAMARPTAGATKLAGSGAATAR